MLSQQKKAEVVQYIINYNSGFSGVSGAESTLNSLTEKSLLAIEANTYEGLLLANVVETTQNALGISEDDLTVLPSLIANKGKKVMEDDEEDEEAEVEEEDEEEDEFPPKKGTTNKRTKFMTTEQWLLTAPLEIREAVTNAAEITAREKDAIVESMTVNCGCMNKKAKMIANLEGKTLGELREMQELFGSSPSVTYFSTPGATTTNSQPVTNKTDFLPLPTIDWNER